MSLVIAYATEHFTVMSGDFRRINIENNDEYYDDTPKIQKVNKGIVLGLTGDCTLSLSLSDYVKNNSFNDLRLEEVAELVSTWLNVNSKEGSQQTVILAGCNELVTISHENKFSPIFERPQKNGIIWRMAFANVNPEPLILKELNNIKKLTSKSIRNLAKKVNKQVAKEDTFVSERCSLGQVNKV